MSVPAKLFQHWLDGVAGHTSHAAVCRAAGIKRSTLAQQLVRGRVSMATVAAVGRSLQLPVLEAIAAFPEYADLATGAKAPSAAELLSQISDMDLLAEILSRSAAADAGTAPAPIALSAIPHRASVRSWLDAIDPGDLRQRVAREAGIAPQNLSAQISANRLSPELAITCSRIAGAGLGNGLVATGFLSPVEAGWTAGAREGMLRQTPNSTLLSLAAERLEALGKTMRRMEQDTAAAQSVWENLG